jgi:hypothetical protein
VSASPIAESVVDALDDEALAALAAKIAPFLVERLSAPVQTSSIRREQAAACVDND